MPYAKVDADNRIIEWSFDRLDGLDVEFSNGEYVNENCVAGSEDFIIKNGKAVYSPTPEKEVKKLKNELEDDDYISSKFFRALITDETVDIQDLIDKYRAEYRTRLEDNNKKVARINELS